MRIQLGTTFESNFIKNSNLPSPVFQKNQIINGKILAVDGNELEMLIAGGKIVKASVEGKLNLPLNSYIDFEVVESSRDLLVIKPIRGEETVHVSQDRVLTELSSAINIKPSPENMKFLERCNNLLGISLSRLGEALLSNGKTDIYNILKEILIEPGKTGEYLKRFEKENGAKLTEQLKILFESVMKKEKNSPIFARILGDIAKSILIKTTHPFPLIYIPVPLIYNNKLYPSEIWIEKDPAEEGESKNNISFHLLIDTPYLGRVEADIICSGSDLGVDLYCSRENLHLFEKNLDMLKERISSIGFIPKWIKAHELKENNGFIKLSQKYIKPLPPLDVRV